MKNYRNHHQRKQQNRYQPFKIYKASGQVESFSKKKLVQSLERSGLPKKKCEKITECVAEELGEGAKTSDIFRKTLQEVRRTSPLASAQYSLKKSLFDLGPEGHFFEDFVSKYFEKIGYITETCKVLPGRIINHEVDVVASLKGKKIFAECKFHNHGGIKNDVKISLYVKARWDDLREGPEGKTLSGFYVVSNTAFSLDAMTYAQGTGLKLLGINSPVGESFFDKIKKLKLYPITSLRQLNRHQKHLLLSHKVILASELLDNTNLMLKIGMTSEEIEKVLSEVELLHQDHA